MPLVSLKSPCKPLVETGAPQQHLEKHLPDAKEKPPSLAADLDA